MTSKQFVSIILILTVSVSSIFGLCLSQVRAPSPIASLTGAIDDVGVDTDGDGAFNYLEVSVVVNVTDAWDYQVEIIGLIATDVTYIDIYGVKSEYLDAGLHTVNISLYGPAIYMSGLNFVNVSDISLSSLEYEPPFDYNSTWLESQYDVPLSETYLFTEFDSPFKDIEAQFVVYPNGRVVMDGSLNYTDMEEMNPFLSMYGDADLETVGSTTDVSTSFTFRIPEEEGSQFPFNSSTFEMLLDYSDGLLTSAINGSTIFPISIASEFPFNITDFTVKGNYADNVVSGNFTVDVWNGFPLDDILLYFQGNTTYIHLNGSTTVIFGSYPDLGEINSTVLEDMLSSLASTFEGQDSGSLYNMTNGILEFTMLNNVTTLHNGNASIDFEAQIEGDLILGLVNMTGQSAPLSDLLSSTWSSIESGSLLLTYTHALHQADMSLVFVVNMTDLIDNVIPFLSDVLPPDEAPFVESLLNMTYWAVSSGQISLTYEDEQMILNAAATIHDLNAELNYIKTLVLTYNFSVPFMSQLHTLNDTQLDFTEFQMHVDADDTSLAIDMQGFAVMPPLDWINATDFKLTRFFNMTANDDYEPPIDGERLKVSVGGGSNATHTVRIFRPGTVPDPDMSAPGGMVWGNQSISSLKDLVFQVGPRDDGDPVIGDPVQTPETPDDGEVVIVSVNVTDADTGVHPDGVILSYRAGDGWINVTMSKVTGDEYEGEIPGMPGGTYVEYMIVAYDYAGNAAIDNQSGNYYVYTVIPEFPTLQVLVLALVLLGVVAVIVKRKRNVLGNSLSQLRQKVRVFLRL